MQKASDATVLMEDTSNTKVPASSLQFNQTHPLGNSRWLAIYLCSFVATVAAILVATLGIASTRWFLQHDNLPYFRNTGYGLRLQHADCDVVIYGDSTSLTGLEPSIVEGISGLKTCNISEGVTLEEFVGTFPLDEYLAHNKRPRFLLTMYSPLQFRPLAGAFEYYSPEGVLYGLQNVHERWFYLGLLRHIRWTVQFAAWAGSAIIDDTLSRMHLRTAKASYDARTQRDQAHGAWRWPLPPESHCTQDDLRRDPAIVWRYAENVAQFRSRYGVEGTTVLVDIAPLPACDLLLDVMRKKSEGLHDNDFEVLPVSDFNESDIHPTTEGARYTSVLAGRQVLKLEQEQDANSKFSAALRNDR